MTHWDRDIVYRQMVMLPSIGIEIALIHGQDSSTRIHTPMCQGGTQEAKVGVMFWERDHWRLSPKRAIVKHREYVATLEGVEAFREHLNRCYSQTVQQRPHQVVFLGDGAAWIWDD